MRYLATAFLCFLSVFHGRSNGCFAAVHSAGNLLFYILSGGVHCFGAKGLWQQVNIINGAPDYTALLVRSSFPTSCCLSIIACRSFDRCHA